MSVTRDMEVGAVEEAGRWWGCVVVPHLSQRQERPGAREMCLVRVEAR